MLFCSLLYSQNEVTFEELESKFKTIITKVENNSLKLGVSSLNEFEDLLNHAKDESIAAGYKTTWLSDTANIQYNFYMSEGIFKNADITISAEDEDWIEKGEQRILDYIQTVFGKPDLHDDYRDGTFYYGWKMDNAYFYFGRYDYDSSPKVFIIDIK